jgi:hypothetical protein
MPAGKREYNLTLFVADKPIYLVFGLVDSTAYSGLSSGMPFKFAPKELSYCRAAWENQFFPVDGMCYYNRAYLVCIIHTAQEKIIGWTLNFSADKSDCSAPFLAFQKATGYLGRNSASSVNLTEFLYGSNIYCFRVSLQAKREYMN